MLYPAHSRFGRENLGLKYSVPQFSPNSGSIAVRLSGGTQRFGSTPERRHGNINVNKYSKYNKLSFILGTDSQLSFSKSTPFPIVKTTFKSITNAKTDKNFKNHYFDFSFLKYLPTTDTDLLRLYYKYKYRRTKKYLYFKKNIFDISILLKFGIVSNCGKCQILAGSARCARL